MTVSTMTRRTMGGLCASALTWAAVRGGWTSAVHVDAGDRDPSHALLQHPVQVPANFVGMHAHRWPAKGAAGSPAPTYAFGAARSHDHDGLRWNQIHLSSGQYDWRALDRWVSTHSAAHRTLIFTLYGTPAWLASEPGTVDLYGSPGGATPPREVAPLADFLTELLRRYNEPGTRRIHWVETWNEPHFEGTSRDYWTGNADQLAALSRTAYRAAKTADRDVRVLSPGFVGDLAGDFSSRAPRLSAARRSSLYQFLTAADGAGGRGSQWCDGLAFHTYNVALRGNNAGALQDVASLRLLLQRMGLSLPLFNTELGFVEPHPFRAMPPAEQATQLKRIAALQASRGVQMLCLYAHDDALIGDPAVHPEIAAAVNEIEERLAGVELQQIRLSLDGAVQVQTSAGAFTW